MQDININESTEVGGGEGRGGAEEKLKQCLRQ